MPSWINLMAELQKMIEAEIPPMTTVGQIMSRNPRLISPETPAEEALDADAALRL